MIPDKLSELPEEEAVSPEVEARRRELIGDRAGRKVSLEELLDHLRDDPDPPDDADAFLEAALSCWRDEPIRDHAFEPRDL
ncbi:MAG: hypothetical protein RLY93_10350 [Sumerlaeia bacterium]